MEAKTARQRTAAIFFALGHQRRLKIVETLSSHPNGITYEALGTLTGIPEGSLTHHLRFLRDANLISRKIIDCYSFYTLNQTQLDVAKHLPHAYRAVA